MCFPDQAEVRCNSLPCPASTDLFVIIELKRTPVIVADLLWRPFESRFQDVIERMKFHRAILKDELNLAMNKSIVSKLDAEEKRAEAVRLEAERHAKLSEEIKTTLSELTQRECSNWEVPALT